MVAIGCVAHFSIPVSDAANGTKFYTEVVGCRHLSTTPNGQMVFLVNPVLDNHGGVHHAFVIAHDDYQTALDHLRAHGVEITFEENRQSGVLNGPPGLFPRP